MITDDLPEDPASMTTTLVRDNRENVLVNDEADSLETHEDCLEMAFFDLFLLGTEFEQLAFLKRLHFSSCSMPP